MEEGLFEIMLQYHILEGKMETGCGGSFPKCCDYRHKPLGPTGISLLKLLIISISVTINCKLLEPNA